jgi:hypothetical protein
MSSAISALDAVEGSSNRHQGAIDVGAVRAPLIQRSQITQTVTTISLDIAKSASQFMPSMQIAMWFFAVSFATICYFGRSVTRSA